jgi:DNA replicative helicase MCM subunit Mcm2 (Cdc46/Mcm family)
LYARGEQPVQKYKDELAVDGDLSYLNLNWEPVPIIPKFVDIVVNGMSDRMYAVKAFAQDELAAGKRSGYKEMIEKDMVAKDFLVQTQEQFGINAFNTNPKDLPENDQELNLHMQLNYKPAIEIAEEVAIDTLLEQNRYQEIKRRVDYDMTVLGVGMVKHTFQPGAGIRVEYVDPAAVVYSYTESPTFDDCFYYGEIKQVHIGELIKIDPTITKEELDKISKLSSLWF